MIPLRDNVPSRTFPVVNIALIGLNVLAFIYELALGQGLERFMYAFGVVPQQMLEHLQAQPLNPATWIPFLSSMFLHGGFLHLGGNMLSLWIFGDNVEDRMGHFRYLLFYLAAGLAGGLAHVLTNAPSVLPSIGASGAIAGVMGAYVILYPNARVLTLIPIFIFIQIVEIPAVIFLGFWFLLQFFSGTLSLGAATYQQGGVAWWAHIGGFLVGAATVLLFYRRRPAWRE
jgi:membrane associated rhomboid family serine protease